LTSTITLSSRLLAVVFTIVIIALSGNIHAQYKFKTEKQINCTEVKNQANTGTCWSFATASFLESELMRMGHRDVDLSEMYIVRNIYQDKAKNYVLRQGKANFSQGSLSHDLMRMVGRVGVMPETAYSGMLADEENHNHSEMERGLKGFLDGIRSGKTLSHKWPTAFSNILDAYMGTVPNEFAAGGEQHTPTSYAESLGINADNYVSLTSFSHHPFYSSFILEIPDNYSNGAYYNIPVDELISAIDFALLSGYTVAWDGDVSEKGFSSSQGIAVLPTDPSREDLFTEPGPEVEVNQDNRQALFESYATTDDHLMHLVGISLDQNGNKYYLTKNSWGARGPYEGYLYMSEAYVKMKTVAIMIHKDAVPTNTANKLW